MVIRRHQIVPSLVGIGCLLWCAGCSDNVDEGTLHPVDNSTPKPPESVSKLRVPSSRTSSLLTAIAQYRAETFGAPYAAWPVANDGVFYTAAFRHAVYLNTVNSEGNGIPGTIGPGDLGRITATSTYATLDTEAYSGGSPYPSLFTNYALVDRVRAVVDGPALLEAYGAGNLALGELHVFDGDVSTGSDAISAFRGYARSSSNAAENLWYTRRGRQYLMRACLRYADYGQKDDEGEDGHSISPPYPLLDSQFLGTWVLAWTKPVVNIVGIWPNDAVQTVNPFGLDTDMNGPLQYAGPPIHLTMAVSQPFIRENGLEVSLTRVDNYNGDPVAATPPYNQGAYRRLRVFTNVSGLSVVNAVDGLGGYTVQGPQAPVIFQAPMANSTQLGAVVINNEIVGYRYRIQFDSSVDLGTTSAPVVQTGDLLTIKVADIISPQPTSSSVGEYQFTITAVNYGARTVDVQMPDFVNDTPSFESMPNSPSTLQIRYGNIANVLLSVTSASVTGSVTAEVDTVMNLGNGEAVVVPTAPLEPNAWYYLVMRGRTATTEGDEKRVYFRTNDKGF